MRAVLIQADRRTDKMKLLGALRYYVISHLISNQLMLYNNNNIAIIIIIIIIISAVSQYAVTVTPKPDRRRYSNRYTYAPVLFLM